MWDLEYHFHSLTFFLFSEAVDCGKPSNPENGVVFGTSTKYPSEINYECDKGYDLVGPKNRKCQAEALWSGNEPICEGKVLQ